MDSRIRHVPGDARNPMRRIDSIGKIKITIDALFIGTRERSSIELIIRIDPKRAAHAVSVLNIPNAIPKGTAHEVSVLKISSKNAYFVRGSFQSQEAFSNQKECKKRPPASPTVQSVDLLSNAITVIWARLIGESTIRSGEEDMRPVGR